LLHDLANDVTPALLHCSAGKDRAGLSIAVVLLAVGVERSAIEAGYLLSNGPRRRGHTEQDSGEPREMSEEVNALLSPILEARAEYLAGAFQTVNDFWGTTDRYLSQGLRLAAATRERLLT
jgi:protein-tyrosine phosphatase